MNEIIYCGNAKIIDTKFGKLTKVSMHKDDINKIVGWMKAENRDWVNIAIKEKKEPKEGKPTHYLEIDQYKPDNDRQVDSGDDNLPF